MVQCLLVCLFNFKRFASFFNHDVDNNFVGFFHAFFSQGANVGKGFFNIFAYNAVAGLIVVAGFAHVVADNACFNGVGNFTCAGCFCTVANHAAGYTYGVGNGVADFFKRCAMQVSNACTCACACAYEVVMPWLPLPEQITTGISQPFMRASLPAAAIARARVRTSGFSPAIFKSTLPILAP